MLGLGQGNKDPSCYDWSRARNLRSCTVRLRKRLEPHWPLQPTKQEGRMPSELIFHSHVPPTLIPKDQHKEKVGGITKTGHVAGVPQHRLQEPAATTHR